MNGMDPTPQEPQAQAPPLSSPALSDAMERLLAHPELLASVASAIGLGKPNATQANTPTAVDPPNPPEPDLPVASPYPTADLGEAVAAIAPLLSAFTGKGSSNQNDPRSCLLRALKPYVSPGRAQAIDTILRLSLVSEAIKKVK